MPVAFLLSALVQFALGLAVAWILEPAGFAAYSFAVAAALFVQMLAFEWLRLATTRFHRAGRDGTFGPFDAKWPLGIALLLALVGGPAVALLAGGGAGAAAMVPVVAALSGLVDLRGAALRAAFDGRGYLRIVVLRSLLSVALVLAAALHWRGADAAMIALVAALLATLLADRLFRGRGAEEMPGEPRPELTELAAYSGPVVVTNLVYAGLFLGFRALISAVLGLAAAGPVHLALDVLQKVLTTLGSAADLWLFQVAVRHRVRDGAEAGRDAVRRNFERVAALLSAAALGAVLLVAPFEALAVPPAFRGGFATAFAALTPALLLFALVQYGLHPFAQIDTRTGPLVRAALLAGGTATVLAGAAVALGLASPLRVLAGALAVGMLAAVVALARVAGGTLWKQKAYPARWAGALLALVPGAVLAQGLAHTPILALAAGTIGGFATFLVAAYALDLAGLRSARRETIS